MVTAHGHHYFAAPLLRENIEAAEHDGVLVNDHCLLVSGVDLDHVRNYGAQRGEGFSEVCLFLQAVARVPDEDGHAHAALDSCFEQRQQLIDAGGSPRRPQPDRALSLRDEAGELVVEGTLVVDVRDLDMPGEYLRETSAFWSEVRGLEVQRCNQACSRDAAHLPAAEQHAKVPTCRPGFGVADAATAGDHVETALDSRGGHVKEAHAVLLPWCAARQPRCLTYPEAAVVQGLDRVEHDDGELPALKAVCGANLCEWMPAWLHVPQRLQGGLGLCGIWRDYPCSLAVLGMKFDQCPG